MNTISAAFRAQQSGTRHVASLQNPLVFVHLPKSAGTSLYRYLLANFPAGSVAPPFVGDFDALGLDNPERKLFWGHFLYRDIHSRLPNADYFTFLRDPIARSHSQYKSWNNPANFPPDDPWRALMPPAQIAAIELAQKMSFDEFVLAENPRFDDQLINTQTAMLSSVHASQDGFLETALENLESMLFFGLTEEFSKSLDHMRARIDGLGEYAVDRELENRGLDVTFNLGPVARRRLEDLIQVDMKLYDRGLTLFSRL